MSLKQFRASSAYSLLTGTDGLTEAQQRDYEELMSKIKLTEKQAEKRNELEAKMHGPFELPTGAKTYIEELVDRIIYEYKDQVDTQQTLKGTQVEDESILLVNTARFTNYKKSDEELSYGNWIGHPDIVDNETKRIIDIKSSWSKKTFPKRSSDAKNLTYEWQVKCYLYMKRMMTGENWREGEVIFCLVDTPIELLRDYDDLSLHEVNHLPIGLRITSFDVYLSDKDIEFIENRGKAAALYAAKYESELQSKC